ncbi:MAG: peptide chain release factor 2 [Oscillospiraceae bacterium]
MLILDEVKRTLDAQKDEVSQLFIALDIDKSKNRLDELEMTSASPEFYAGNQDQNAVFAQMGALKDKIELYDKLTQGYADAQTMLELCAEDPCNDELLVEAQQCVEDVCREVSELRLVTLLRGEYDKNNAILTFHAGAGGTEAQDWVEMLYRMYTRFSTAHGFNVKVLDYLDGDEAGIKSVSILVEGHNAFGFLHSENGVHRLVRISPFDSSGRRHTSFASLEVMPELDADMTVDIRPEDIKMEVFRSSGAGGQHINKTSSAIRVTYLPTGMVVECQDERSQYKNKDKALKVLRSRLFAEKQAEHDSKIAAERKGQVGTGDRSERIRTYNYPQGRLTDHRIGLTLYRLESVLDGDLDEIIDALITADQAEKLKAASEE